MSRPTELIADADAIGRRGASIRVVFITGAGQNIGAAIARRFASDGNAVVLAGRTLAKVEGVASEIRLGGGSALALEVDVTSPESVRAGASAVRGTVGSPDVLIHCASQRHHGPVTEMSDDALFTAFDTAAGGLLRCAREFVPTMSSRGWGRVIALTGISGDRGVSGNVAGSAAKAGLTGFVQAMSKEIAPSGVTVNAVSPGIIATDRPAQSSGRQYENEVKGVPAARWGEVEDVAAACHFIASDAAGYMTGQVLRVNGGMFP